MAPITALSAEVASRILQFFGSVKEKDQQQNYISCSLISRHFRGPAQELMWRKLTSMRSILRVMPAFTMNEETGEWGLPPFTIGQPPISAEDLLQFDKIRVRVWYLDIAFDSSFFDICPNTIALLQRYYGNKIRGLFPKLLELEVKYTYETSLKGISILHFLHSPVLKKAYFWERQDPERPPNMPNVVCHHVVAYLSSVGFKLKDNARFKLVKLSIPQAPDHNVLASIKRFRNLTQLDMERNHTVPIPYDFIDSLSRMTKLVSFRIMTPKFLPPEPIAAPGTSGSTDTEHTRLRFPNLTKLYICSNLNEITNFLNYVEFPNIDDIITSFWVHEDTYRFCTYNWADFFDAAYYATKHINPIYIELIPVELHADARTRFANMFDVEKFPSVPFEEFSESLSDLNLHEVALPDPLVRDMNAEDIATLVASWPMFYRGCLEDESRRRYARVNKDIGKYNKEKESGKMPILKITEGGVFVEEGA